MWVTWHGMGGTAWQTAKAEAWPPSEAFGFGFESLGGERKACDSPGWRLY